MAAKRPQQRVMKDTMSVLVADAICTHVRQSAMKPGDKLPSERDLAATFSTGRNTVREALKFLSEEGLLLLTPGRRASLLRVPQGSLQLELMKVDYKDLLDIKMWLEQLAIRRAAQGGDGEKLQELDHIARQMEQMAQSGEYSIDMDRRFHTQLLACAQSQTLAQLILGLIDALNGYAGWLPQAQAVWQKTVPFHRHISQALLQKKTSAALAAHEYIHNFDLEVLENPDEPSANA